MKKIFISLDSANPKFISTIVQQDDKRKLVEFGKPIEVEDWVYDVLKDSTLYTTRVSLLEDKPKVVKK